MLTDPYLAIFAQFYARQAHRFVELLLACFLVSVSLIAISSLFLAFG